MDRVAVLIPCYNEAATIESVVSDFLKVVSPYGGKIYVYDNNSTDDTAIIAAKAGAIVRHEYLQGKGNVVRRMFREIQAQCYLIVDGDNTYPAESAPAMIDAVLQKKVDMVIGDRLSSTYFTENKRPFHNFGNTIVRKSINMLFHSNIQDVMTGYRAFSYQFVKSFPVLCKGFEIETEMTIHAIDKNMFIENHIVTYRDRPNGSESKLNTFSDGAKVIWTIVRLLKNYKPLMFFGLIAAILIVISAVFFLPVWISYLQTGMVDRFPTLIVCGFIVIAALQSFFTGLTLHTIKQKNMQDFELALVKIESQYEALIHEK